jgi:hypothetical protein
MTAKFEAVISILADIERDDETMRAKLVSHVEELRRALTDIRIIVSGVDGDAAARICRICDEAGSFNESTGI